MHIGDFLREYKQLHGYKSFKVFSQAIGVDDKKLEKWVQRKGRPTEPDDIDRIMTFFGVRTLNDLSEVYLKKSIGYTTEQLYSGANEPKEEYQQLIKTQQEVIESQKEIIKLLKDRIKELSSDNSSRIAEKADG